LQKVFNTKLRTRKWTSIKLDCHLAGILSSSVLLTRIEYNKSHKGQKLY